MTTARTRRYVTAQQLARLIRARTLSPADLRALGELLIALSKVPMQPGRMPVITKAIETWKGQQPHA